MLSQKKIVEAIDRDEIEISISFCYNEEKLVFCEPELRLADLKK